MTDDRIFYIKKLLFFLAAFETYVVQVVHLRETETRSLMSNINSFNIGSV